MPQLTDASVKLVHPDGRTCPDIRHGTALERRLLQTPHNVEVKPLCECDRRALAMLDDLEKKYPDRSPRKSLIAVLRSVLRR